MWTLKDVPAKFTTAEDGSVAIEFTEGDEPKVFHGMLRQLQEQFNLFIKSNGKNLSTMTPPPRTPLAIAEGQEHPAQAEATQGAQPQQPAANSRPAPMRSIPMQQPITRSGRGAPAAPSLARRPHGRPPNV
jgi:hypothetical protein